jgi:hypothetical protein
MKQKLLLQALQKLGFLVCTYIIYHLATLVDTMIGFEAMKTTVTEATFHLFELCA